MEKRSQQTLLEGIDALRVRWVRVSFLRFSLQALFYLLLLAALVLLVFPALDRGATALALVAGAIACGAAATLLRRPTSAVLAKNYDDASGLKDRVSSSVELLGCNGPMIEALHEEAAKAAGNMPPAQVYPVTVPREGWWMPVPALLVLAVLFLPDLHNHPSARPVRSTMNSTWPAQPARVPAYQLAAWVSQLDIPALRVSVEYAKGLLDASETLDTLSETADTVDGAPGTVRADVVVQITATVDRTTVPSHNVVGLLEGSDPALREEWVILCAHYDHEGTTAQGIFRGADDDASGVAGLLEIAEAYVTAGREGRSPRRSILFAAWNAEERGLLGSWAYAERPLTPLERTVAVLNMDMIGRHEEVPENGGGRFRGLTPQTAESNHDAVNLLGYTYSADLRAATETANTDDALELRFRYDDNPSNLLRRSDHWPFLFSGVPALFVHTGLHPDYHTERDTPDKLDYEKMSRVVGLVHQLSWNLAQANGRPAFLPRVRAR